MSDSEGSATGLFSLFCRLCSSKHYDDASLSALLSFRHVCRTLYTRVGRIHCVFLSPVLLVSLCLRMLDWPSCMPGCNYPFPALFIQKKRGKTRANAFFFVSLSRWWLCAPHSPALFFRPPAACIASGMFRCLCQFLSSFSEDALTDTPSRRTRTDTPGAMWTYRTLCLLYKKMFRWGRTYPGAPVLPVRNRQRMCRCDVAPAFRGVVV